MKVNKILVSATIAAVVCAGVGLQAQAADKPDMEKCAGIVKAGKNDCASGNNACSGQDKQNNSPDSWIFVPKGTCNKIVGGKVVEDNTAKSSS